jgi:hypothetical protein
MPSICRESAPRIFWTGGEAKTPNGAWFPVPESTPESARAKFGRIGAYESWANTPDRAARTAPGRAAALARFEKQVDPNSELPPAERAKRAEFARKAYFQRLALKSAQARKRRAVSDAV